MTSLTEHEAILLIAGPENTGCVQQAYISFTPRSSKAAVTPTRELAVS
ncbi:unnamed protein product, partial [marine sediment metagenome]